MSQTPPGSPQETLKDREAASPPSRESAFDVLRNIGLLLVGVPLAIVLGGGALALFIYTPLGGAALLAGGLWLAWTFLRAGGDLLKALSESLGGIIILCTIAIIAAVIVF